ncbi:unnamed protein product [Cuscuta campestris]|uniref:Uncharacterized protein n=1 Tax=Cuscuta campestris TaxID=132261 RepID=A0A484KTV3_9ASTE|nr:unnamed protein product [Cuscuta campestris]
MAMGPERSRPLHNFTLPCELKWGNRKFLRCVKLDSNGDIASVHRRPNGLSDWGRVAPGRPKRETVVTSRKFGSCVDAGIASVREKLMFDLQTAADQMKDAIFREGLKEEEEEKPAAAAAADPNKPWSLRTRRTTVGSTKTVFPLRGGENASPALPVGEKRSE